MKCKSSACHGFCTNGYKRLDKSVSNFGPEFPIWFSLSYEYTWFNSLTFCNFTMIVPGSSYRAFRIVSLRECETIPLPPIIANNPGWISRDSDEQHRRTDAWKTLNVVRYSLRSDRRVWKLSVFNFRNALCSTLHSFVRSFVRAAPVSKHSYG